MTMMFKALIWDVDGTLAETEDEGHRVAFNRAFADEGLAWHWDSATYLRLLSTTGGKERLLRWWRELDPASADTPRAQAAVAHLHQLKNAHYARWVEQGEAQLRPGVRRLLLEARAAGVQLAIATTTSPGNVSALLRATLGDTSSSWFAAIGAGDQVAAKKPAPDIYQWTLQHLGLRAGQCLAIEDSAVGARAASAAGLPVLVTRSRTTAGDVMPAWCGSPGAAVACGAGLLADLNGLGQHSEPARGLLAGQSVPWQGLVDLQQLNAWWQRRGVDSAWAPSLLPV